METLPDGRILPARTPEDPQADHPRPRRRHLPHDYIVPFTQQVHDRISLEVLRGCTQGCRFCQAGMTTRPVRERSLEKVDELMTHARQHRLRGGEPRLALHLRLQPRRSSSRTR
jgi:radical SAM superfamily enzyme YgiQ (UPF0313 family)